MLFYLFPFKEKEEFLTKEKKKKMEKFLFLSLAFLVLLLSNAQGKTTTGMHLTKKIWRIPEIVPFLQTHSFKFEGEKILPT